MTNKERNLIKRKILKCLTEDFKGNQHIFDKKGGWQVYHRTDLDMVMNAVVKGLEMAKHEIEALRSHDVVGQSEQLKCEHQGRRTATELVEYCEDCKKILFHP